MTEKYKVIISRNPTKKIEEKREPKKKQELILKFTERVNRTWVWMYGDIQNITTSVPKYVLWS